MTAKQQQFLYDCMVALPNQYYELIRNAPDKLQDYKEQAVKMYQLSYETVSELAVLNANCFTTFLNETKGKQLPDFSSEPLILPEGMEAIPSKGFKASELSEVIIPESVRIIGDFAFDDSSFRCQNRLMTVWFSRYGQKNISMILKKEQNRFAMNTNWTAKAEQAVRETEEMFRNRIEAMQSRNHLEQKKLEKQIAELEQKLSVQKAESDSEHTKAVSVLKEDFMNQLQKERDKAFETLQQTKADAARREKDLQEELAHYKELKAKSSTKMIGETLEQHCELSFEMVRTMAFPNAYFKKDNDATFGSKGDYIFRDYDDSGMEYISIMFEMKNEAEDTKTKHKNSDFFKKLDKDRTEKNCEYAVLVSLLEADNENYNRGIVKIHDYEKMYVIRPQMFLEMIALLRDMAKTKAVYQKQVQELRSKESDKEEIRQKVLLEKKTLDKALSGIQSNTADSLKAIDTVIAKLQKIRTMVAQTESNTVTALSVSEQIAEVISA